MSELENQRNITSNIINKKLTASEKKLLSIYKSSLTNIRAKLLALNERSDWTQTELLKYNRLNSMQDQILLEIKDLSSKVYQEIKNTNKDIYLEEYNRSSFAYIKEVGVFLDFDKINTEVLKAVIEMPYPNIPLQDFIKKIGNSTYEKLKFILGSNLLTGEGIANVSKQIKDLLGVSYNQALRIARTEGLRARSKAQLETTKKAEDLGLKIKKRWLSTLDFRTRPDHQKLDQQYADKEGFFHISGYKALAPRMFGVAKEDINCFTKDVEVLTDEGYKFFYDLNGTEKIVSLNPKTYELEYVNIKNIISKRYLGKIVNLKNHDTDISMTPEHDIYCISQWKFLHKKFNLEKKQVKNIVKGDVIPKVTKKWNGDNKKFIEINNKKYDSKLLMQFMGWYLSEGSTSFVNNTRYQINICQHKETFYNEIKEICINLFEKVWLGKNNIYIRDNSLGEYLFKLGHSHEKYIPKDLKTLDIYYLRLLLDCFNKGDGSIVKNISKNTLFAQKKFKDRKMYYTSSNKLADDIGELILKCGHFPSFKYPKKEDYNKKTIFKNGTYYIKHPCIWIGENVQENYRHANEYYHEYEYDDLVYCIELEKNHIMNVRKNGKTIFMGNCRCTYTEEVEGISEPILKRKDNITKELIDNMSYDEWYNKYRVKK